MPQQIEIKGKTIEKIIKLLENEDLAGKEDMQKLLEKKELIPERFEGKRVFFLKDEIEGKDDNFVPYIEKKDGKWKDGLKKISVKFAENDAIAVKTGGTEMFLYF